MNPFAAALPAFDRVFGETIRYDGAGLDQPSDIVVIWSDVPGESYMGAGATVRTVSCEIRKEKLPGRPGKADVITRNGVRWSPVDIRDADDVAAWVLVVERAA
jgi:hypothetical protein